jgi:hypothetical protein
MYKYIAALLGLLAIIVTVGEISNALIPSPADRTTLPLITHR